MYTKLSIILEVRVLVQCILFKATLMYDAKQKLKSIHQASNRKISSEELIKYAHKISAGNSIACPPDWILG